MPTPEHARLRENDAPEAPWHEWGPYVSDRQWGTVREDYSADGDAWDYFPHDHARSRAYRWGEDGIGGFCDRQGTVNVAVALWNGHDPILKERLFGLTNGEGNHGEDVKELYFHLDATPTHSYQRMLYRYPQAEFPYRRLVDENRARKADMTQPEFELLDTGVLDGDRYFDVEIEVAKAAPDDILFQWTVTNQGPDPASLWVLPHVWSRNRWSWGGEVFADHFSLVHPQTVKCVSSRHGTLWFEIERPDEVLFTENETNRQKLYGEPNPQPFIKDAFHEYIVGGDTERVNPAKSGTKACGVFRLDLAPGEIRAVRARLSPVQIDVPFGDGFTEVVSQRKADADAFYDAVTVTRDPAKRSLQRAAFAGLLWSKQFYRYDVRRWLEGDPHQPPPPPGHDVRNRGWGHMDTAEVLSMPDKWEYPWFAAWDLAFHTVPMTLVDAKFAKEQLITLLREWYMHPNGQVPAYEWAFGDVNPPVHAWAAHRVFTIDRRLRGGPGDVDFLKRCFHKLLLNFTWWVNRKDVEGNNLFEGGFMGLDNIGVFDRNRPVGEGFILEQSDTTSWMAMYCLNMLSIALELAKVDPAYDDVASKFFEHFVYIAKAAHDLGLWDDADGFFYDVVRGPDGNQLPIKARSAVGLIPLLAVTTIDADDLVRLSGFRTRLEWFGRHRPDLLANLASVEETGSGERHVLSLVHPQRLRRILARMLDEGEFLSPYGLRSLSKVYATHPYGVDVGGQRHWIDYEPGESTTGLFGGNSNWRGPVWFPINYLLIEALQRHHWYLGDDWKVEFPTGSGRQLNLWQVSLELGARLTSLFLPDESGRRPVHENPLYATDPKWKDLVLFYEYFHGDTGRGIGASHQTGWTALVAKLIDQTALWA
ncbi:MAG: hypothetical protein KF857_07335 [Fimbriimonadaceae bacterium]|nr:hypothetical protein [Fimbriimonadaceae bacterium]